MVFDHCLHLWNARHAVRHCPPLAPAVAVAVAATIVLDDLGEMPGEETLQIGAARSHSGTDQILRRIGQGLHPPVSRP
jgi:hypothetical protein